MYNWISRNLVAFVASLAFGTTALMLSYQNRVVQEQRELIVLLSRDSFELAGRKLADARKHQADNAAKLAATSGAKH